MKKLFILITIFVFALTTISCKNQASKDSNKKETKKETVKKKPTVPLADLAKYLPKLSGGLEYVKYSTSGTFLHIYVKKGEKKVLWFQVFDKRNEQKTLDGYKKARFKVGKYNAKKFDDKWVWVMINNIEIRCVADTKEKEYQNTDKLVKFIQTFDLAGLEKL